MQLGETSASLDGSLVLLYLTPQLQAAEKSDIKQWQAEETDLFLFPILTGVFCHCRDNLLCSRLHY